MRRSNESRYPSKVVPSLVFEYAEEDRVNGNLMRFSQVIHDAFTCRVELGSLVSLELKNNGLAIYVEPGQIAAQ